MGFIDRHKAKAQIKGYDLVQDESAETVTIVKKFSRQSVESFSGVTVASAVMMASRKIDEMPVLSLGDQ